MMTETVPLCSSGGCLLQIVSQEQHVGSQLFAAAFVMGSLIPGIIWGAILVSWHRCQFDCRQHALPWSIKFMGTSTVA